nr:putative reverse transcriptase domain-containing protein [Tanacetum cinerariifolium]
MEALFRRWIELLSDYDCEIRYHPRKANVVVNALSRKEREKPLRKEKLYAKFSKCEFWLDSEKFLGHVINSQGVHVDPAKVGAIKSWTALKSPTE